MGAVREGGAATVSENDESRNARPQQVRQKKRPQATSADGTRKAPRSGQAPASGQGKRNPSGRRAPSKKAVSATSQGASNQAKAKSKGQAKKVRTEQPMGKVSSAAKGPATGKANGKAKGQATTRVRSQTKATQKNQLTPKGTVAEAKKKRRAAFTVRGFFARLIPIVCLAGAFVAIVGLYRFVFPPVTKAEGAATGDTGVVQGDAAVQTQPTYRGVEDPWVSSGYFTTGDENLDPKVKEFCDAYSKAGETAPSNALNVYNTIMWNYSCVDKGEDQKPAGPSWAEACARDFLSRYAAAGDLGGEADYYELAAIVSFCLRYFGYSDALAVPVVIGSGGNTSVDAAYCLVTSETGSSCICDPTRGAGGWMIDRYSVTFMVDDIGQDLTQVEAMGLQIRWQDTSGTKKEVPDDESAARDETSTKDESATTDENGATDESSTKGEATTATDDNATADDVLVFDSTSSSTAA